MATDAGSAIRGVLERANEAQAEAFTAGSPLAMRTTSTTAHYQDTVDTNRALASAGVTAIALVRIEFGDVRVDGARAQATTLENLAHGVPGRLPERADRSERVHARERGGCVEDQRERARVPSTLEAGGDAFSVTRTNAPGTTTGGPGAAAAEPAPPLQRTYRCLVVVA